MLLPTDDADLASILLFSSKLFSSANNSFAVLIFLIIFTAAIIDGTVREGDQVTVDADKDGGFTVVCDNTPAATYEVPDAE